MKRVISMVLALMLVMSLAVGASAATVVNDTDHAYAAYQIFSGTQNPADANLGHPAWGSGVNGDDLLADLKADTQVGSFFADCDDADDVAGVLSKTETPSYVVGAFAQAAYNNLKGTGTTIAAGATSVDVAAGYYLIVDTTVIPEGTVDALNPALLQITNAGPIHIQKKYDTPEADKSVIADDAGDAIDHVKKEDAGIGVPVEFHLNATMPTNMYGYKLYPVTFHDSLSAGLTLNPETIELYLNDSTTPVDETLYEVVLNPTCDLDDDDHVCDFHVVIPAALAIPGFTPGCELKVKYTATPNDNALVIEYNDYRLEFGHDPNWTPGDPANPTPPTGVTPWHEVEVHHTGVEIRKVDGATDQPLMGAGFTLTGTAAQKVKVTEKQFTAYADGEAMKPGNEYWKLKDGTYTTWDPALPETDVSVYVEPVDGKYTKYYAETVVKTITENVPVNIEAMVGADGTVSFEGLGEGEYTVTETKVPAGYNGLKEPMKLIVTFHEADGTWEYSWSGGGVSGTGASIQIDNLKGSVLPETGGVGTTLFYAIGGLMVAAAVVLLVTKKRVAAE